MNVTFTDTVHQRQNKRVSHVDKFFSLGEIYPFRLSTYVGCDCHQWCHRCDTITYSIGDFMYKGENSDTLQLTEDDVSFELMLLQSVQIDSDDYDSISETAKTDSSRIYATVDDHIYETPVVRPMRQQRADDEEPV